MYSDTKTTRLVADAVTKIMMGEKALHPNQQKLDVHEPEKDELTADDFKKLRAGKKAPEVKKEEVEQIDEVSLKTATSAYVKRVGRDETGADPKAAKTISHIANRYGVKGVARAAKSANRRKSFCARMGGMKKRLTSAKTANDPDSRINKALRKWNCEE